MSLSRIACFALSALIFSVTASAHVVFIEEEALYVNPKKAPESADWSFAFPFELDNGVDSKAISSYLKRGDIDVFRLLVTPDMVQFDPPVPALISASALPYACEQTKHNFPVTALLAPLASGIPGLDPAPEGLPFDIPPGYGVTVADNPEVPSNEERPVFDAEGFVYFLPLGLTQECLTETPWTCDYSNTILTATFFPGDYYIIMWDPDGKAQDYTANIGFSDENYYVSDDELYLRENDILHKACTVPYQ